MPTVRYTADGGRYRVAGVTLFPGDTVDVSEGKAEHLVGDVGDFERVDEHVTDVEYTEADGEEESDEDICGVEMSGGDTCERPADECPYHGDGE